MNSISSCCPVYRFKPPPSFGTLVCLLFMCVAALDESSVPEFVSGSRGPEESDQMISLLPRRCCQSERAVDSLLARILCVTQVCSV